MSTGFKHGAEPQVRDKHVVYEVAKAEMAQWAERRHTKFNSGNIGEATFVQFVAAKCQNKSHGDVEDL